MAAISLNRRFSEWTDKEAPDPDMRLAMGLDDGGVGWEELLTKHRVVILAEAGSGKTTEMTERARTVRLSNPYTFCATVEDVGLDGLENALSRGDRERLAAWRASADDAWFFVDSVDEAKSSGIRLEKVVRRLADGILNAEPRAHIILSGRITDWEFRKDLDSLNKWLPISSEARPAVTPEDELLKVIRNERRRDDLTASSELPFIAIMLPLNRDRVRLFAQGMSAPNVDGFLDAVEAANLWHFARRPLDLDWLVRFWQSQGRLGSLSEMVERSVMERLRETNPDRARQDKLDNSVALHAVERIGSAMVFSRQATIEIPDRQVSFTSAAALQLAPILPDWSEEHRLLLLSRPVFDPATLGRARFHNDNDGVVRAFLTARWLLRLRNANLPTKTLLDLLFTRSYGLDVIRPSLRETAAWLSLWDTDVAKEVIRRDPSILLSSGDPASLSPAVRKDALLGVIEQLLNGNLRQPWWDTDKLRRFSQPDLGAVVADLWTRYRTNREVAVLLLRLTWLGALKDCAQMACDAAFDDTLDKTSRILAGRALLATCDELSCEKYADMVVAEKATLPARMISDAVDELFPTKIGVDALLEILEATDIVSKDAGFGFDTEGPILVERLSAPSDIEILLSGLLSQVGSNLADHAHQPPNSREEAYYPAIAQAALRLLELSPPDTAPGLAVDAILQIFHRHETRIRSRLVAERALAELHRTSARRRSAFWHVAQELRNHSRADQKFDQLWLVQMSGYSPGLSIEDVDWLLADGLTKGEDDRRLAVNAALSLSRSAGDPPDLLKKISEAVRTDAVALAVFKALTEPSEPSPKHVEMERERKDIEEKYAAESTKRDQSWIDFVRDLRSDAARIARLRVPLSPDINPDLFNLWKLLDGASNRSRHAIESVAPLEGIAGHEVASAVKDGLIALWRSNSPRIRSGRSAEERNTVWFTDLMGLAGVTLEATSVNGWATRLSSAEATAAARYATLEINGFPEWISALIAAKPAEVRAVLMAEIADEISRTELNHRDTLNNVAHSDRDIVELLAPAVLDDLKTRIHVPVNVLPYLLNIIVKGISSVERPTFVELATKRFETETDADAAMHYLAAVFAVDPKTATQILKASVASMGAREKAASVDRFLIASFGGSMSGSRFELQEIPPEILEELVRLTFSTHDRSVAQIGPGAATSSKDQSDEAEHARNAVFSRLLKTPGNVTYQAILRLQNDPNCPVSAERLRELAQDRAIEDSESAPWLPSEAFEFEQHHETSPRTAKDLLSLLVSRLEDIQHELLHGDFNLGLTLARLPKEVDVQNWVADRLRLKQGRSFSVEREPHVVGEKEPDVRVRAKATDAHVAMEIKVAESWTLRDLEDALEVQLCGRYLRATDGRFGALLLVHQDPRTKGWEDKASGTWLSFPEVVERLSAKAVQIAGKNLESPQPVVCVLDVSGLNARP
jgi:hypothetical protein